MIKFRNITHLYFAREEGKPLSSSLRQAEQASNGVTGVQLLEKSFTQQHSKKNCPKNAKNTSAKNSQARSFDKFSQKKNVGRIIVEIHAFIT